MTIISIVKPETLLEFRKELKNIRYCHLLFDRLENKGNLYLYSRVEKTDKNNIIQLYWLIFRLNGHISVNTYESSYSHADVINKPVNIYFSEYPDMMSLKSILVNYKENDHIKIEAYLNNASDWSKEKDIIVESVIISNHRPSQKISQIENYTDINGAMVGFNRIDHVFGPDRMINSIIDINCVGRLETVNKLLNDTTIVD